MSMECKIIAKVGDKKEGTFIHMWQQKEPSATASLDSALAWATEIVVVLNNEFPWRVKCNIFLSLFSRNSTEARPSLGLFRW